MNYMRMIALFTVFIFLSALGGDSFAETLAAPPALPVNNTAPAPIASTTMTTPAAVAPLPAPLANKMTTAAPSPAAATTTTANAAPAKPAEPADTRPVVGKVIWVKGVFTATAPNKAKRELIKGDAILLHDTLMTSKDTQAQIVFTDDTLMTFRPETTFVIDEYEFQPASKTKSVGKYLMNLITGGFRTITGLIAKSNPPDYRVNTPVATIGVRGTDYSVMLQGGQLLMGFDHGTPCVSSGGGSMCLGSVNRYVKVNAANAKPVALKQQPDVFRVPLPVQPVVFTPPQRIPNAGGTYTAPKGSASSSNPPGSFCIK